LLDYIQLFHALQYHTQAFLSVASSYLVGRKSYGLQMLKPNMVASANGSHFAMECPANMSAIKAVRDAIFTDTTNLHSSLLLISESTSNVEV
jgi:hypothetical protein